MLSWLLWHIMKWKLQHSQKHLSHRNSVLINSRNFSTFRTTAAGLLLLSDAFMKCCYKKSWFHPVDICPGFFEMSCFKMSYLFFCLNKHKHFAFLIDGLLIVVLFLGLYSGHISSEARVTDRHWSCEQTEKRNTQ